MPSLVDTINKVGIAAWGSAMPVLNPSWTNGATSALTESAMSLSLASGTWTAPIAGTITTPSATGIPVTLLGADGAALAAANVVLLTLHPQAHLRLARLFAQVLEDKAGGRAERDRGLPFRPVPRYVRYSNPTGATVTGGNVNPGDDIGVNGDCTIHDADGLPIDPVAVAAAFAALMEAHNPLQRRALGASFDSNSQVKKIAALAGTPSVVRIRLSDPAGLPYDGSNLQGVTAVPATPGLFTLNASSGNGSDLTGTVTVAAASTSFPAENRRLLKLGPATTGRLGETFKPPALPSGVTLARDFFSVRVVELGTYLRGTPNPAWDGTKYHDQPEVRLNEPVTLLADGNDVLGAAAAALDGSPTDAHVVAQTIEADFTAPPASGTASHWPNFPTNASSIPITSGPLPVNLRDGFTPVAVFLADNDPATPDIDVVLTLNGLPEEAHVRVYTRLFLPDAREGRGDGAGGIAHAGSLVLLLRDPLRLRKPGQSTVTIPPQAQLKFDVVVVKRTGETRIYGNVVVPITSSTGTGAPFASGPNPFASAPSRGVSNAAVLGLEPPPLDPAITDLADLEAVALALSGEGQPRDAPRLPTMAHRELIVAGRASGSWRSVLSGGRLAAELHNAEPRIGAPGGLGGRETQAVGLGTTSGRLAYDLARAAFRRTTSFPVRIVKLADGRWDLPAEPAALTAGTAATQTQGTIAAAALQTIAPACATPEFYSLRGSIDPSWPSNFANLVTLVETLIKSHVSPKFPHLQDIIKAIDGLKTDPHGVRLFDELKREIMTSSWGRRDAQWALMDAIGRARRFIYIETPGFLPTQKDYTASGPTPPYAADLISALASRLNAAPGLHLMICTPRKPDFGPGYETAASYEAQTRRSAVLGLPSANAVDGSRVVAFHPVGFPGRPSRFEATVVIVDDVWALVGACTLRRRGLTFDGSTDVVLTDMDLVNGACPSLRDFRRTLLASRLGVSASGTSTTGSFGVMPNATHVRLADGVEAFYAIREQLKAGGLGKIERLWTGETPGVPPVPPLSQELADPDGLEFNLAGALTVAGLGSLASL